MGELKFLKGMNKDFGRLDQPDNTYRDALNAVIDPTKGAVSNEYGTKLTVNLIDEQNRAITPVGQISLPNDDFIIFGVSGSRSYIVYIDTKVDSYQILLKTPGNPDLLQPEIGSLNFKRNQTIYGEFRISPKGEIIIYFTDNYYKKTIDGSTGIEYLEEFNPIRTFNVTKQQTFLSSVSGATYFHLYSIPSKSIDSLNLFKHSGTIPFFNTASIVDGGGIESGAYYLGLSYADDDFTETNVLVMSNPVYIVPAPEKTIPFEVISGAPNETQTGKSIVWNLTVTNSDYKYVIPYIVQQVGTAQFVYKLSPVEIKENLNVTYTGIEGVEAASIDSVIVDKVRYATCRTFTQVDNRLYLGNLTARKDSGFQRFANRIKLEVGVETINNFDSRKYDHFNLNEGYAKIVNPDFANGEYSSTVPSDFVFGYQIYQNGRVFPYLQTIIAVQENASKGYRDEGILFKKKTYRRGEVYSFYISLVYQDGSESYAYHIPGRNIKTPFEQSTVEGVGGVEEVAQIRPDGKIYQYVDTSLLLPHTSTAYWENQNEFYPDTNDFDIFNVDNNGNSYYESTLRNLNVRHHKMPSNKNSDYSFIDSADYSTPNLTQDTDEEGNVVFNESVRILFVQLSDIKIPKFILQQIQGFKIYYGKRTQANKTIIGQSGLSPAQPILAGSINNTRERAIADAKHMLWFYPGFLNTQSLTIESEARGAVYLGQPVVKFHDFNLLRKKPTVATATHIDLQYVMTMQHWRGGFRGMVKEDKGGKWVFTGLRSGYGDPDYSWVHPDLGNMIDYEYNPDQDEYDVFGPENLDGRVAIAAKYSPINSFYDIGVPPTSTGGYFTVGNANLLLENHYKAVFMLEAEGATYLQGLSFFKNPSSTALKGASYIVNNSGESSLSLSLVSGIPTLYGWYTDQWVSKGGEASIDYSIVAGVGEITLAIPGRTSLIKSELEIGRPNMYLANLCVAHTNVFNPFDTQQLVFTGYYHAIINPDYETGIAQNQFSKDSRDSYYTGVTTSPIYGGDTYICRYSYRTTAQNFAIKHFKTGTNAEWSGNANYDSGRWIYGDIPANYITGYTFGTRVLWGIGNYQQRFDAIKNTDNWVKGSVDVQSTVYQYFVESDDNINYRHAGDVEKGVTVNNSMYFDKYTAAEVLYKSPLSDLTKMDNILYEDHFSAVQDVKVTVPFPKREVSTNLFPNRVIRSLVQTGSFNDPYSYFLPLDYKDFDQNKGQISKVFKLDNLLYVHTERSLFRTKGKQTIELGDATQAYVGSGNIFGQEPDEFIQTIEGYVGNYNQFGSLLSRMGYIFIGYKSRKIFAVAGQIKELSVDGLDQWCIENIPFTLEAYGYNFEDINIDAPTGDYGFTTTYDPLFNRIIITKREIAPTETFISLFNSGLITFVKGKNSFILKQSGKPISFLDPTYFVKTGWTLSYSIDFQSWVSRHGYASPLYTYNSTFMYSFSDQLYTDLASKFYVHNDMENPGLIYDVLRNFEIDVISTGDVSRTMQGTVSTKNKDKILSSVQYTADVFKQNKRVIQQIRQDFNPGFTNFYVYNTTQISGDTKLVYLNNIRKVDNSWSFNDFRDISRSNFNTSQVVGQVNVQGNDYEGTYTYPTNTSMFLSEGVINIAYIDNNKNWYEKKKFVDKFIGVRLIANNQSKSLINLYSVTINYRASNR